MDFVKKIRKNEIKQPIHNGFSLNVWNTEFSKITDHCARDTEIRNAGIFIFKTLNHIREKLNELRKYKPDVSKDKLLMAYFSLPNRDFSILKNNIEKFSESDQSLFSVTLDNNRVNNSLDIEEIVHGSVDGISKAISFEISDQNIALNNNSQLNDLQFVQSMVFLSQMYEAYESYWQSILWGNYSFVESDKANKSYLIQQPLTQLEACKEMSYIRKSRLNAQLSVSGSKPEIQSSFLQDKYLYLSSKEEIKSQLVKGAAEEVKTKNCIWRIQEIYLEDEFPKNLLEEQLSQGFSISEVLDVFRCLMLLSIDMQKFYPRDDGFVDIKKLIAFCPKLKKISFKKQLSKATNLDFVKITKILDFLEYKGQKNADLWGHPIISIQSNSYIFLTSAITAPVMTRLIENWFKLLAINIDAKGLRFETSTIEQLNQTIAKNLFVKDYDQAETKRFKFNQEEEEIDLILRIGNTIIIGELKSIVTTDSSISSYRTLETLKRASEQVQRKREFVEKHIEQIFDALKWNGDPTKQYKYFGCIISSSKMFSGMQVNQVPIVDMKILECYFDSNIQPLLTNKEMNNIAWIELYNDEKGLEKNLTTYLTYPPQVCVSFDDFEYKDIKIPELHGMGGDIIYRRLISKNITPKDYLKKPYKLPLVTVENIDDKLQNIQMII